MLVADRTADSQQAPLLKALHMAVLCDGATVSHNGLVAFIQMPFEFFQKLQKLKKGLRN